MKEWLVAIKLLYLVFTEVILPAIKKSSEINEDQILTDANTRVRDFVKRVQDSKAERESRNDGSSASGESGGGLP